jgi:hypothetical protein
VSFFGNFPVVLFVELHIYNTVVLREFQKRGTVPELDLYVQMYRIEKSRIVEQLKPIVINSFDDRGQFKPTKELLAEIRASK